MAKRQEVFLKPQPLLPTSQITPPLETVIVFEIPITAVC